MTYPQYQGKPNIILVSFVALCALVVITIFFLILRTSYKSNNSNNLYLNNDTNNIQSQQKLSSKLLDNKNNISLNSRSMTMPSKTNGGSPIDNQFEIPPSGEKQIFHIKNNIFSFGDAPAVCKLYGADLATIEQLQKAQSKGADWCSGGWTKEGLVAYPIQQSTYDKLQENDPQNRNICGLPGINFLNNNNDLLYGVNCYGVKRNAIGIEKLKQSVISDKDIEIQHKMNQLRQLNINLTPWNSNKWSEYL